MTRAQLVAQLDALRTALAQLRLDADADLAAALQQELAGAIERYEALKARAGKLDFLDLLLKARDLVKNDAGVRRGFQRRFTHIFVDEFQDTDPLQAELLLLLASENPDTADWHTVKPVPGRLFIVGDPKQSIYRFRRADVGVYRAVCEQLQHHGARIQLPDHQLPERASDSGVREHGVCAGHDRGRGHAPGPLRSAQPAQVAPPAPARRRRATRARAIRHTQCLGKRD